MVNILNPRVDEGEYIVLKISKIMYLKVDWKLLKIKMPLCPLDGNLLPPLLVFNTKLKLMSPTWLQGFKYLTICWLGGFKY